MLFDLYVGTRAVGCRTWLGQTWIEEVDGSLAGVARLSDFLATQWWWRQPLVRPCVRVWWSGGLCAPFLFKIPQGAERPADLQGVARTLATQRSGSSAPIRVWAQAVSADQAMAVVVSEDSWADSLRVLAARPSRPARLLSAAPWWSLVLRRTAASPDGSLVGVRDCDSLTVVGGKGSSLQHASSYALLHGDADAEAAWLRAKSLLPEFAVVHRVKFADRAAGGPSLGYWGRAQA